MSGDYKPSAVVIDNNKTPTSQRLISELNNSISMNFRLVEIEEGKELIEKGNVIGGIIIPEFFDQQVLKGEEIDLELIKSKDSLELFQLQNTIRSEIFKLQSSYITAVATIDVLKSEGIQIENNEIDNIYSRAAEHWNYRKPINIKESVFQVEADWAYNPRIHYLVGFTLFFSTFTIVFVAGDILREKEQKTWYRKLVSPISKWKIMTSLLISTFVVGFGQMLFMVLAGRFIFNVNWGMNVVLVLGNMQLLYLPLLL
jgi:ABC-2 type transport system permease protein